MERVTGLASTVERTAGMLGAGLAGLLVAGLGAANALLVDAVSFALSAAVLAWATRPLAAGRVETPAEEVGPAPYVEQLRAGWRFLRGDRVLLGITIMVAMTNLVDAAWASVLMPVWAVESGNGAKGLGLLFAVFSGASALGAVTAAVWAARLPRYATYLVAFLVCGAPRFVAMAFASPLALIGVVVVSAGFASGFLNPILGAVIFERIPAPLVGRVSSLTTALCFALLPFGGLLGGVLIAVGGLPFALVACGVLHFAVDPRWREIERRPEPAADCL